MRINVVLGSVTLGLVASVLAACGSQGGGSSASGDYCSQLKADKTYFESLSSASPDLSQLDEVFSRVHALAASSPSAVASDWKTLDDTLTKLQDALKQAGLKPSDLAAIQKGQMPQGVDLSKLQALAPKLQSLGSADVSGAATAIAKNAKDTCGVDLTSR
jgi:hypothetical protein